jgi:hypothetical protein
LDRLFLGIAMVDNFNVLIGMLVSGGQTNAPCRRIPVPVAVESNTEEAWKDFQDSQMSYDMEYATTLRGSL